MRRGSECFRQYLSISEADRAWGLYVTCGGYLHSPAGVEYPPPGHPQRYQLLWQSGRILDEFQLHFITRGRGVFESPKGKSRQIEAGVAFLLFPGTWHRYRPIINDGWDEYWIGFNGEQARRIMRAPFFSAQQPVIVMGEAHALLDHFTDIVATLRQDPPGMQRTLAGLTGMLLADLQVRIAGGGVDERGARAIQDAKRRIAEAVEQPFHGSVLAKKLGVNYHWLRRAFRLQTGMSLNQYHMQLRVHAAMQLLESGDHEVRDVASKVGFEDPYYFSRVFRKQVGTSPRRWLDQRRGQA